MPGFLIAAYSLRFGAPDPQISSAAYPPPDAILYSGSAYPPPSGDTPLESTYPPPGDDGEGEPQPPQEGSISDAAMKAIDHIADRNGIPKEAISVEYDHTTEYPSLGRQFQVVTLLDIRGKGRVYKLLVDLSDGRITEDISSMLDAEAQAHRSKYGNLSPDLYSLLQIHN